MPNNGLHTINGPLALQNVSLSLPGTVSGGGLQFTPTFLIDAENATIGATYTGSASDQWTGLAGQTIAQNDVTLFGQKAWRMRCPPLSSGFGQFGGSKEFAPKGKGTSTQAQISVYFPSASFSFAQSNPLVKLFRFRTSLSGSPTGYITLYVNAANRKLSLNSEIVSANTDSTAVIQYDTWETLEMRVDWDDVPASSGGTGRVRVWRNVGGLLVQIIDQQTQKTLTGASNVCDAFYMFTYWNGEPSLPAVEQICYADRIIVETDVSKLVETDAQGNKIIGGLMRGV